MWRITGYSVVMPLPPSISRASRAPCRATRTLLRLATETCPKVILPLSLSAPSCTASSRPVEWSVTIRTSFSCTSWREAIGLPKVVRPVVYSSAV